MDLGSGSEKIVDRAESPLRSPPTPNRKRKRSIPPDASFVWARDGDRESAKEHPAYLLSSPPPHLLPLSSRSPTNGGKNDKGDDDEEELVWVQWASNGTVSRIPKSNISSELTSSRRSRRSSSGCIATSRHNVSPENGKGDKANAAARSRRSRLSLTKKQRRDFKEHHSKRKCRKSHDPQHQRERGEMSIPACGAVDLPGESTHRILRKQTRHEAQEPVKHKHPLNRQQKIKHKKVARVSFESSSTQTPMGNFSVATTAKSINKLNQKQPSMPKRSEIAVIDIIDTDEEGEEKKEHGCTHSTVNSRGGKGNSGLDANEAQEPVHWVGCTNDTICRIDNGFGVLRSSDIGITNETNYLHVANDENEPCQTSRRPSNDLPSKPKASPQQLSMPARRQLEQPKSQFQIQIPGSLSAPLPQPSHAPPRYTDRSSAYVQHLAEACMLIMTDARWHVPREAVRGAQWQSLFSWEEGDDLSAVKAFMSLYDGTPNAAEVDSKQDDGERECGTELKDGEKQQKERGDEVFERAMHLYSRMFHRRGPWFDLADLYVRYYSPKSAAESSERKEPSLSPSGEASGASEKCDGEYATLSNASDEKIKGFFTPRPSRAKNALLNSMGKESIDDKSFNEELSCHQTAMERLFRDILRLLSMGLIRTFQSEYECGSVAGNVMSNGRGTLLSADDRRDILRRLGGGKKSPRAVRAAACNGGGIDSVDMRSRNEILNQMQSQRSVVSSFAQTTPKGGGEGGGNIINAPSTLLPVRKHVDKLLLRKLALRVATFASGSAPRKSEIDEATRTIRRALTAAARSHRDSRVDDAETIDLDDSIASTTFRMREAPLRALRRCLRLFLCAGGGPGAMRGDGTNGWRSVVQRDESGDANWHDVAYPGLSSRLGLERYELGRFYAPVPPPAYARPSALMGLGGGDAVPPSSFSATQTADVGPFSRRCEFRLWELGVEMRSFVDRSVEACETERQARRRRERGSLRSEGHGESFVRESTRRKDCSDDGKSGTAINLLNHDGLSLLTEEGRRWLVKIIVTPCFYEAQLFHHTALDLLIANLCHQIEADILLLSNATEGDHDDGDGFISDTERMMAAYAVVCNRVLRLRIRHPSRMLILLSQLPWLRHLCFDAILVYVLWDCVPILERRGHHLMAVSILQTILFGQVLCRFRVKEGGDSGVPFDRGDQLQLESMENLKIEPHVMCLLPRRNRGKAYERLLIDIAHTNRRIKKQLERKPKKKARKKSLTDAVIANEEGQQSQMETLCKALLRNAETFGSIPFCSLRNLARRLKASLPCNDERSILNIRTNGDGDWSPQTDCAVANAISSDNNDSTAVGKRCAFVGWEMLGDTVEAKRSLNVEELAMEEYHSGRLPSCGTEGEKGQWVGWHNEGGHVRALFRIICLPHLLESCSQDKCSLQEQTTVFLSPYQHSPHDLHVGYFKIDNRQIASPIRSFYERRRAAIESFLSTLARMDECSISSLIYDAVQRRWDQHTDDRSRLKDPRLINDVAELRTLTLIAGALGSNALARAFRTLCFDYRHWSGGLPDLLLVRAKYSSSSSARDSDSFVDLADWIGEGFSQAHINEENIQSHISMLIDRDDEFLGCSKNADGSPSQQQFSSKKKRGAAQVELPPFPKKLDFMHMERKVLPECMFIEVKSANDRLSERQEDWLSILESCTNARVCKFNNSK